MAPQPSDPALPVFFNVSGVVGAAPALNAREDVLLVQYCLKMIGDKPRANANQAVVNACKAVKVTGTIDPPTIAAITAHQQSHKQKHPNTVVDGRVSPAKGGYSYGAFWTIVWLNSSVQVRHKNVWPRMDLIEGCPEELKAMVVRTLVGT